MTTEPSKGALTMTSQNQLQLKAANILKKIGDLRAMRKGSLCKRVLKRKTTTGQIKTRGPYWYYTFKKNGRSHCKMLKESDAPLFEKQIERFRLFQSLTRQYAEVSHQMADIEAKKGGGKKNSCA